MTLTGKTVVITGGGSGLGADLAKQFASKGARVWIAGRDLAALQHMAARDALISAATADVTDESAVVDLFAASGPVDIVIANAGAAETAAVRKTDLDLWQRMLDVNLTGVFLTLREGLRQMRDPGWGRLISIASTAGLKGYAYAGAYTAAKHGVVGLTRALALETAKTGITVNALCPGFLDTEMTKRSIETIAEKTGMSPAKALNQLAGHNPQGRLIAASEVTAAALWLCDAGSDAINGQAIAISGGEV